MDGWLVGSMYSMARWMDGWMDEGDDDVLVSAVVVYIVCIILITTLMS